MKSIVALFAFVLAQNALASEISCYNTSNSDLVLHLNFDASQRFTSVALHNEDWGAGGVGGWQSVKNVGVNQFTVTSDPSPIGLKRDTVLRLNFQEAKIDSVEILWTPGIPGTDHFRCY